MRLFVFSSARSFGRQNACALLMHSLGSQEGKWPPSYTIQLDSRGSFCARPKFNWTLRCREASFFFFSSRSSSLAASLSCCEISFLGLGGRERGRAEEELERAICWPVSLAHKSGQNVRSAPSKLLLISQSGAPILLLWPASWRERPECYATNNFSFVLSSSWQVAR